MSRDLAERAGASARQLADARVQRSTPVRIDPDSQSRHEGLACVYHGCQIRTLTHAAQFTTMQFASMRFRRTPAFVRSMATLPHQVNKRSGSPLRYLLVLDFEATCGDGVWNSEIIEFPTLLYDIRERELEFDLPCSWILNINIINTHHRSSKGDLS